MRPAAKNISFLICASLACLFVYCASEYNPFSDYSNAGFSITSRSIEDGDTIDVFSSETLQLIITVKELTQYVQIHTEHNRLWPSPDTLIDSSLFNAEPFNFLFSFYDTGWHTITLSALRYSGDSTIDTLSVYVKSPLVQEDIVAYNGDSIVLKTPPVGDNDAGYYWLFGTSSRYVSQACSARVLLNIPVFSGTGLLWVSDGTYQTPVDSFTFSLSDTTGPTIICANEGYFGRDTVFTGDSIFTFKASINDGGQAAVDSASVNGKPFDGKSGGAYYKLFAGMHNYASTNPLALRVFALDRFLFGNEALDTFWVIFSDTIAQSKRARIVVNTPAADTTTTQADSFYISGAIENLSNDSLNLAMFAYVNEQLALVPLPITDTRTTWQWRIKLHAGENRIRLTASDNQTSDIIDETRRVIVQSSSAADSLAPRILSVLADNQAADGMFTRASSAIISVQAYDEGLGIDSLTINGKRVEESAAATWYQDTIALQHLSFGNEIVVYTADKNGNDTQTTVVIFRNRKAIVQQAPQSVNIIADSAYTDSILAGDPDGDTVTFTKSSAPGSLQVSADGRISWTPTAADSGIHSVSIRVWDGYQPVYANYTLFVYPPGKMPPEPVRFETKSEDFPQTLEVGKDSLYMNLQVAQGTGVAPFRFTVRLVDKDTALLSGSSDSVFVWYPDTADTGYQQLVVIMRDGVPNADTLYPRILVVAPNRAFSLSASYSSDTLPDGAVDINGRQGPDTLVFRIADPDHPATERHSVTIFQWQTKYSTTIDSTLADTFLVTVDAAALNGYDTIFVTVTDRGGNTSTYKQAVYYGVPPDEPQIVSPLNAASVSGAVALLTWTCADSDGDSLWYDVYFGDATSYAKLDSTSQTTFGVSGLSPSTAYYWRIVAHDWKSQKQGSLSTFTTTP